MHYAHACAEVQFVSDDIFCFSQLPDASKKNKNLNYFHMTPSDRLSAASAGTAGPKEIPIP